jgi:hypothetical protein
MGRQLLRASREAVTDGLDLLFEVRATVDKGCLMPGVLPFPIRAEPVE